MGKSLLLPYANEAQLSLNTVLEITSHWRPRRLDILDGRLRGSSTEMQTNMVKNPNWREAEQLVIYKHDRGIELRSPTKQLQLSDQSGT